MPKETFLTPEAKAVWKHLEQAANRSHHNTRQAFEDFLEIVVCSLSGGLMEPEYMKAIKRYTAGEPGKRAVDLFPVAFAELTEGMEKTGADVLGDIFMGGVTFGENGQFFTPDAICNLMAQMTVDADATGQRIVDCCCGSGRTLLAAAESMRYRNLNEFYGQDVDLRCVQMTAINLALRGLNGYVIHGDALKAEYRLTYRVGFNGTGVIKLVESEAIPEQEPAAAPVVYVTQQAALPSPVEADDRQLSLWPAA